MHVGKWIIIAGLLIAGLGILIYFFHNKLHWFGRLPGDINITKGNTRFYFPVMTMLLVSVALSLLLHFIKRFFQ